MSIKRHIPTGDQKVDRAFERLYDELNALNSAVNVSTADKTSSTVGKPGDIRVVEGADGKPALEVYAKQGWLRSGPGLFTPSIDRGQGLTFKHYSPGYSIAGGANVTTLTVDESIAISDLTAGTAVAHNGLSGKNGGADWYHLSTADYAKIGNWDTAYGWGDHAAAGYITGSGTDTYIPIFSGSGTNLGNSAISYTGGTTFDFGAKNLSNIGTYSGSGDITLTTTGSFIGTGTSDGSDSKYLTIGGGGAASHTRGAYIHLGGNEVTSDGGRVSILAGDVASTGYFNVYTAGLERYKVDYSGNHSFGGGNLSNIGTIGSGAITSSGTFTINSTGIGLVDINAPTANYSLVQFQSGSLIYNVGTNDGVFGGDWFIDYNGAGSPQFRISSTGAATFAGPIRHSSSLSLAGNSVFDVYNISATGYGAYIQGGGATNYALDVWNYDGTINALRLLGTGAATFASTGTFGGEIRNSSSADGSPYTQARMTIYRDGTNWGYLGYGSDALMRIVYSATSQAHSLLWGTSSNFDGTGTFTQTMSLTSAGDLTVSGTGTFGGSITTSMAAGNNHGLIFSTSSSPRWFWYKSNEAESGGNAGSNLFLANYTDAGAFISNVLGFNRATGAATFASSVGIGGTAPTVRLDARGVDGTTSYIVGRLSAITSGYGSFLQFSDDVTYNFAVGTDPTTGDFVWYDGRYPGVGGTERARIARATGNLTVSGDAAVNGGDLTSTASTFNLLNATPTTINFGGAATAMSVGKADASFMGIGAAASVYGSGYGLGVIIGTPSTNATTLTLRNSKGASAATTNTMLGYVQTSDATATTIVTFDCAYYATGTTTIQVVANLVGSNTAGSVYGSYIIIGTFFVDGSSVPSQLGSTSYIYTQESDAGNDATFVISGTTILLKATGKAATTMNWTGRLGVNEIY